MEAKISEFDLKEELEVIIEKLVEIRAAELLEKIIYHGDQSIIYKRWKSIIGPESAATLAAEIYGEAVRVGDAKPTYKGWRATFEEGEWAALEIEDQTEKDVLSEQGIDVDYHWLLLHDKSI